MEHRASAQTAMAAPDPNNANEKVVQNPNNLFQFGFRMVIDGRANIYHDREFHKPFINALGRIISDGSSLKDYRNPP